MIYIIRTISDPCYIKVGYSKKSIESRLKQIQTGCPYQIELIKTMRGSMDSEKELHSKLWKYKTKHRSEWFLDCEELREILKLPINFVPPPPVEEKRAKEIESILVAENSNAYVLEHFCLKYDTTKEELKSFLLKRNDGLAKILKTESENLAKLFHLQSPTFNGEREVIVIGEIVWNMEEFLAEKSYKEQILREKQSRKDLGN